MGRFHRVAAGWGPRRGVAWGMVRGAVLSGPLVLLTLPAAAAIINVPGDFPTIQAGVDAAEDGDSVVLAPMVFMGTGNRDIDFQGKAITVTGSDPGNPGVVASTVIDCEEMGRGFLFQSGEGAASVLAGLTVTSGFASDGGAVFCLDSSPTIMHCVLKENEADGSGGGLYAQDGDPFVLSCVIDSNFAKGRGGGIFSGGGTIDLSESRISSNESIGGGGGLSAARAILTGVVFLDNASLLGAGGATACPDLTAFACLFDGNDSDFGGALAACDLILADSVFLANGADEGAAICGFEGVMTITGCTFVENGALCGAGLFLSDGVRAALARCGFFDNVAGVGAAIHSRGDLAIARSCFAGNDADISGGAISSLGPLSLVNSLFATNSAEVHGGAVETSGMLHAADTTFSGNVAGASGGGIITSGETTLANCILWANADADGTTESAQITIAGGQTTLDYSCIEGLTGQHGGQGNIGEDPRFMNATTGNFHLRAESPCIDAASNSSVPEGVATDRDGNVRFVDDPLTKDTGEGKAPVVDMGAFEFPGCRADLDGDGAIGFTDLLALLAAWGAPGGPEDRDDSGVVDLGDLMIILAGWGPCP